MSQEQAEKLYEAWVKRFHSCAQTPDPRRDMRITFILELFETKELMDIEETEPDFVVQP